LNPGANNRLVAEAMMLRKLAEFPHMRSRAPRLHYFGAWGNGSILFQSPLQGEKSPLAFGREHEEFLGALQCCGGKERPGHAVVADVEQEWKQQLPVLGTPWESLGREVLQFATRNLEGKRLACAPMHGDFAPWNIRHYAGKLTCFDWESA